MSKKNNLVEELDLSGLDGIIQDVLVEKEEPKKEKKIIEVDGLEIDVDIGLDFGNTTEEELNQVETPQQKKDLDRISTSLEVPYSDEQRAIIRHFGKPLNIVSCAGSGKTAVLIAKMLYTQIHHKVQAYNMLAITFNTKASVEIKERYNKGKQQLGLKGSPEFRTFHSLFLMMLKTVNKYKDIKVVSHTDYLFELLNKVRKPNEDSDKSALLDDMMSFKGVLINNGHSIDGIQNCENHEDLVGGKFFLDNYIDVITLYNQRKKRDKAIDFDDMIVLLYEELYMNGNTELITNFQNVFKYIYMDEYQDISKIQIDIMDKLIEDKNKLVTIGDDDQSSAKRYSTSA